MSSSIALFATLVIASGVHAPVRETTTIKAVPPACSAAGLSRRLTPQPGLSPAAARTRQAIADAATACDYDRLARLARSRYGFRVGFDETGGLRAYLLVGEQNGWELMKHLVYLLNAPFVTGVQVDHKTGLETSAKNYFWPKAKLPPGRFFYGYYVTITDDGQWTAFGNAD